MDEQTKRKMIVNYFKSFPKWAIVLIVIGVPLLAAKGLGILFIALGILVIVLYVKGMPTDQQMDAWLEEDLKTVSGKAMGKAGHDQSEIVADPVSIIGVRLWDTGGACVLFKQGKDSVIRFSPVSVTHIMFTQNQLSIYSSLLDRTTGNFLNESTDEYFYKDVVAVSTKTQSKTVNTTQWGTLQLNAAETFELTTAGGTSVSVLMRDPTLIDKMGGGQLPDTRAEKAIQTIRKMLREKKA